MEQQSNYRIPSVDEFVQGFRFEYLDTHSYRMVIMDFSSNDPSDYTKFSQTTYEEWLPKKVDWKFPDNARITENNDDITIEWMGATYNWMSDWYHRDIQKLIEDGRIRCKE